MNDDYISNWTVRIGFLTGSPSGGNSSWFTFEEYVEGCTASRAIYEASKVGFKHSNDVCNVAVFWIRDEFGEYLGMVELARAEFGAIEILAGKRGDL